MTPQTRPFRTLAVLTLMTSTIASCDPPIDPEVDSGLVADNVASVVENAARAIQAMDQPGGVQPQSSMARFAARLLSGDQSVDQPVRPSRQAGPAMTSGLQALRRLLADELAGAGASGMSLAPSRNAPRTIHKSEPPAGDEISDEAKELRWIIKNRLLAQNNLESHDHVQAIYRLRPEVTCAEPHAVRLDEECARFFGRVDVRLRLIRSGAGHEVELQVGGERVRPLTLYIDPSRITATAELQAVKSAVLVVASRLEEPDPGLPTVMRGAFQLALTKDGERSATFALSLLDMIEVRDDQERSAFRTAAASPALSVRLDGDARKIRSWASVGLTEVITPLDDNVRRPASPDLRVVVAGLYGQGTVDLNEEKLVFQNVGLGAGPSFAEVRGQRIVELNLNAQDKRGFDATVTVAPDGTPRLALAPRFDLDLMFKLALIKAELSSPPPAHLEDETYRLLVDGAGGQGPVLEPFEDREGQRTGVRVVSGQVSLSSSKVPAAVNAAAGQCLEPREPAPGDHPVLGAVQVTTCP
jgi:hypothetical protein